MFDEPLLVKQMRDGYVFRVDEVLNYLGKPTKSINELGFQVSTRTFQLATAKFNMKTWE